MAKARAILKRRKAVKNIRKITRTMQMIATAKFQKSLKRAVGTKPYTLKVRELVKDVASNAGDVEHPLLRTPAAGAKSRVAFILITSNRGLCGGYNGNVIRNSINYIKKLEAAGHTVDIYAAGKKGVTFLTFQKRPITDKIILSDPPKYVECEKLADLLMSRFIAGEIDAVYVSYMNFISAGSQKPDVMTLLPLAGVEDAANNLAQQAAERDAQLKAGSMDLKRTGADVKADEQKANDVTYEFSPKPLELLDELLPLTIKSAFFQACLDATTSEHVARMISMKAATDNAEEMQRLLALQYNRARQSQITTELSEIMGGVEAMKS